MLELLIKFGLDILTFGALTIFIFSMFKLPIKGNDKQIVIIALVVGFINFYFKLVIESPLYFLFQVLAFVILLIVLRRYPILYAVILGITGFIASSLIDSIVSLLASAITKLSIDELVNNLLAYIILHIIVSLVYVAISLILVKYRIGFSFVKRRFSSKNFSISNLNYVWAALLIIAIIFMTILTQPAVVNTLKMYTILLVGALFILSIWYAFKQNKKSLNDRYGTEKGNGVVINEYKQS